MAPLGNSTTNAWRSILGSVKKPTLIECLVVVAIIAVLIAILLPEVQRSTGSARRDRCKWNLKAIGLGLHLYHDKFERFPIAAVRDGEGRALHSWRVLILPFVDQQPLYERYRQDESWDGPRNSELHETALEIYQCRKMIDPPSTETNYLAVVGNFAAWHPKRGRKLSEFSDGMSQTILVVEAHQTGIHWMAPDDMSADTMPSGINPPLGHGMSSDHPGGAFMLLADGSVHFQLNTIDSKTFHALLTIKGDQLLRDDVP